MAEKRVPTDTKVDSLLNERGLLEAVLDKDLSSPPASPSTGDRYIVGASATGDWSGKENYIADWNGSSWDFTTPVEGYITYVKDEDDLYSYDGSTWNVIQTGGISQYQTSFDDGDLSSGVLTVAHNLAQKYVVIKVYDNNDKEIIPDSITLTDSNNLYVNLSSYGTLTSTWNVIVLSIGSSGGASGNGRYATSFVNGDLSSGILTVTHSLSNKYCIVAIYKNDDTYIIPDEVEVVSTSSLTVDLSSFGTITGTWNVVVLA